MPISLSTPANPRASGLLEQVRSGTDLDLSDGVLVLSDGVLNIERAAVRLVNEQGSGVGAGTVSLRLSGDGPPTHVAARWRFEGEGA